MYMVLSLARAAYEGLLGTSQPNTSRITKMLPRLTYTKYFTIQGRQISHIVNIPNVFLGCH